MRVFILGFASHNLPEGVVAGKEVIEESGEEANKRMTMNSRKRAGDKDEHLGTLIEQMGQIIVAIISLQFKEEGGFFLVYSVSTVVLEGKEE